MLDRLECSDLKQLVGGRLVVCTSGGAALDRATASNLEKKLGVKVISLYGTRETGGIARDGEVSIFLVSFPFIQRIKKKKKVYKGVVCLVRREDKKLLNNGTGEVGGFLFDSMQSNEYVEITVAGLQSSRNRRIFERRLVVVCPRSDFRASILCDGRCGEA